MTKLIKMAAEKTYSFKRCSRSPRGAGIEPLIRLFDRSLRNKFKFFNFKLI